MSENDDNEPTFTHPFRTLVNYQKSVLRTLVMNEIESQEAKMNENIDKDIDTDKDNNKEQSIILNDLELDLDKIVSPIPQQMTESELDDTTEPIQSSLSSTDSLFQYFIQKIKNPTLGCKINILCMHTTHNDSRQHDICFPFVQYLLEKRTFNYNQLALPSIIINKSDISVDAQSIETMVVEYISTLYKTLFPQFPKLTLENCYVGACHLGKDKEIYALLDVSSIWADIHYAGFCSNNSAIFALPSEIINAKNVCGMPVDDRTIRLFSAFPELSRLQSSPAEITYPVPDVGYTFHPDINTARFACMFGPPRTICENGASSSSSPVFTSFEFYETIEEGKNSVPTISVFKQNNGTKAKHGGTTRYAVYYPESGIIQNYNLFCPMTYHISNKTRDGIL